MNPILTWITAACILGPLSSAAPQLFPFSSLSSYFDQRTRNGPGADQSAVIPQFIANAGNAVRANGGERFPRNHLPANHRPASLTDLPEQVATPVGYDIIVPHRIRQDNVNTQSAAIPLQVFLPENIFNPPPQNQKPLVYYPERFVKPEQPKKVEVEAPAQKPLVYYPERFVKPEQPKKVEVETPAQKSLVYYPEVFDKPEQPKLKEETPVQKPLVYYPEVIAKPEDPKVEEQTSAPPSAPSQQLTPPKETEPEYPPEKIAKNHAYPKKYQPEVNKKTNAKSTAPLVPTVKEKREPGKQHKNSFLPAHEAPRGITEQEAAETGFASVTAGLRGLGDAGGSGGGGAAGGGDRVQFQMHGLQGPHSYKFGYDTGKGKNRQFRYEERDNKGHVRGHYGFYNKHGKLQVVNYEAHPEHGFRADSNFGKHSGI